MKTTFLVGIVVAVHCVAIGAVVLVQGGCGTPMHRETTISEGPMPPSPLERDPAARVPAPPAGIVPEARTWPAATTSYKIRKGDTLSGIAYRYGLSVNDIVALNSLERPDRIREGQKLVLPGTIDLGTTRKPSPRATVGPVTVPAGSREYVVKPGDCLSAIASAHGIKTAALRKANNISGDRIIVGQKLVVPGKGEGPVPGDPAIVDPGLDLDDEPAVDVPEPAAGIGAVEGSGTPPPTLTPASVRVHVVTEGEDLYSVAMMWGVSVDRLKTLNGLGDGELEPGQRLKIPLTE